MKRVKCKKEFGTWFYKVEKPEKYGTCILDGSIYHLYNDNNEYVNSFGSYGDMKYYIETKIIL